jgi:hypothetical protein
MIRRLVSALSVRLTPRGGPPVPPGTGQRIQTAEQEAAKARILALAHRRAGGPAQ